MATVRQYGRWPKPPKQVLPDQAAAQSAQDCDIDGPSTSRKFKSEWAASYTMATSTPGKVDAPPTQGPPMVQHALPGPSDAQVQPGYANVSIFFLPFYFFQFLVLFNPNINLSQRDINPSPPNQCFKFLSLGDI
jgi:hypothetical protein